MMIVRATKEGISFKESYRQDWRHLALSAATATLFGILAYASIKLAGNQGHTAAIWIPNALVVAFLLRNRSLSLSVTLLLIGAANMAATMAAGQTLLHAAGVSVANMFEIGVAATLTLRFCGREPDMRVIGHLGLFVLAACLIAPAASALIALPAIQPESSAELLSAWARWAGPGALGMLLGTPILLIIHDALKQARWPTESEIIEWTATFAGGTAFTILLFAQSAYSLLFLAGPVVLIYAFRLGTLGTALAVINIALIAAVATSLGHGPLTLINTGAENRLIVLELFLAINFAMGLPVAAVLHGHAESQRELKESRDKAHALATAKTNFLANMSHEIRTPMNGVLGFTQLMLDSDLQPAQRRHVERIAESGYAMMRLLNDILDISRIESGRLNTTREAVTLKSLLENCIDLASANAAQKGLDLQLAIDPDLPAMIETDSLRLRQIVLNLLGNAVKFSLYGRVGVIANAEDGETGPALAISVLDTGPGIDPDRMNSIFEPFEQGDASMARRHGGSGLGLAISRELAELIGGTLSVTSQLGKGSCFTLRIPLISASYSSRHEIPPASSHDRIRDDTPGGAQILLAEDNDVNAELVAAMISRCGHGVTLAKDGLEAVRAATDAMALGKLYNLVLMDLQMPGLDGYNAAKAIRSHGLSPQVLPIIALTANAFPEDVERALASGMQAHLAKPLMMADLQVVLERWLPRNDPQIQPDRYGSIGAIAPDLLLRWQTRRKEALEAVSAMLRSGSLECREPEKLARIVHKMAGTAAMFGEAELGKRAGELEHALRQRSDPEEIHHLAKQLMEAT